MIDRNLSPHRVSKQKKQKVVDILTKTTFIVK